MSTAYFECWRVFLAVVLPIPAPTPGGRRLRPFPDVAVAVQQAHLPPSSSPFYVSFCAFADTIVRWSRPVPEGQGSSIREDVHTGHLQSLWRPSVRDSCRERHPGFARPPPGSVFHPAQRIPPLRLRCLDVLLVRRSCSCSCSYSCSCSCSCPCPCSCSSCCCCSCFSCCSSC